MLCSRQLRRKWGKDSSTSKPTPTLSPFELPQPLLTPQVPLNSNLRCRLSPHVFRLTRIKIKEKQREKKRKKKKKNHVAHYSFLFFFFCTTRTKNGLFLSNSLFWRINGVTNEILFFFNYCCCCSCADSVSLSNWRIFQMAKVIQSVSFSSSITVTSIVARPDFGRNTCTENQTRIRKSRFMRRRGGSRRQLMVMATPSWQTSGGSKSQ